MTQAIIIPNVSTMKRILTRLKFTGLNSKALHLSKGDTYLFLIPWIRPLSDNSSIYLLNNGAKTEFLGKNHPNCIGETSVYSTLFNAHGSNSSGKKRNIWIIISHLIFQWMKRWAYCESLRWFSKPSGGLRAPPKEASFQESANLLHS